MREMSVVKVSRPLKLGRPRLKIYHVTEYLDSDNISAMTVEACNFLRTT